MALTDQRQQAGRYTLIPRTLVFLLNGEDVLLIRYAESKGTWAGLYNGIGGHIERGESPMQAARREVHEECGLPLVKLAFCGTVIVDSGAQRGIGLYVFVGRPDQRTAHPSSEGDLAWVAVEAIQDLPLMPDMAEIFARALASDNSGRPFTALSTIRQDGEPVLTFD